jgi:lipopolysaccharide export system permease protein
MRILDRMVVRLFLRLFIVFVLGAPLLFLIGDLTERIDRYLQRGLTGMDMAYGYLLEFPKYMLWSFPIAALIAAVFTVHSMTAHREVVAAKAGGISFRRLVAPIIVLGVILTGVALVLTEIVPRTTRMAAEVFLEREVRKDWRSNFVYQAEDGRTITVQRLSIADASLSRVVLQKERDGGEGVESHMVAETARYDPEHGWTFYNGYLRHFLEDGLERAYQFRSYQTRWFSEKPEELLEDPPDDEEMTYAEIGRMIDMIQRSGGDPLELEVEREQKLAIPVATLVIILFGLPLATTSKRGGASFGIGVSLASTILYMVLLRFSAAIGDAGAMPPLLAAWFPNIVFLVVGATLFLRVRT